MSTTTIEWTGWKTPMGEVRPGYTFNPWIGCEEISPGCDNCYAREGTNHRVFKKKAGRPLWGPVDVATHIATGLNYWNQPTHWNRELGYIGEYRRVFCASVADVFEDNRPLDPNPHGWKDLNDARRALWVLIQSTPRLLWLLLTKRPHNIHQMVPRHWTAEVSGESMWPRHVRVGCTVENEARAAQCLPHLLAGPWPNFVSYEPALEEVNFARWMDRKRCLKCGVTKGRDELAQPRGRAICTPCAEQGIPHRLESMRGIEWLICGGESGRGSRAFQDAWARAAFFDARRHKVPFFNKQRGAVIQTPEGQLYRLRGKGGDLMDLPEDLRVREWPR